MLMGNDAAGVVIQKFEILEDVKPTLDEIQEFLTAQAAESNVTPHEEKIEVAADIRSDDADDSEHSDGFDFEDEPPELPIAGKSKKLVPPTEL